MSENTYNGWTNWETWSSYLWLSNEEWTCKICEAAKFTAAEMEEFCGNLWEKGQNPDGAKLTEVDFEELSQAFID